MEMDEGSNPVEKGLLGARAVRIDVDEVAYTIEQEHRWNGPLQTGLFGPLIPHQSCDSPGLSKSAASVVWPSSAGNSDRCDPFRPGRFAGYLSLGVVSGEA